MQSNEQIAVFLDIENFIGFCHALKLPLDLSEILEKLKEEGRIIIRRSFGDLERSLAGIGESRQHGNIRRMLRDNLFNHEDIPYKNQFKNSADMRLSVEMLYTAFTIPTITKFAVITGDSDYAPVFQKLQEQNKMVIGISGSESSTSVIYRNACDRLFYFDDLSRRSVDSVDLDASIPPNVTAKGDLSPISEASGERSHEHVKQQTSEPMSASTLIDQQTHRDEYASLLIRAIKVLEQEAVDATFQALVVKMRQLKSDFNYERAGFDSFHDLVRFAADQQLVAMEKRGGLIFVVLPEVKDLPDQSISSAHYRRALQDRLKCQLPASGVRSMICKTAYDLIRFNLGDDEGVLLRDLSMDVADELSGSQVNVPQAEIFKYLFSLYRSRCFSYRDSGGGPYNPLITGFNSPVDDWDDHFVISQSRQLASGGLPLFPQKLSKLFYESEEKTGHIKRLFDRSDIRYEV